MTHGHDSEEEFDIRLAEGLSSEQREEALRIFAGLRATRNARDAYERDPGVQVSLCPVPVDAAGTPCMLPLPHDTHRTTDEQPPL